MNSPITFRNTHTIGHYFASVRCIILLLVCSYHLLTSCAGIGEDIPEPDTIFYNRLAAIAHSTDGVPAYDTTYYTYDSVGKLIQMSIYQMIDDGLGEVEFYINGQLNAKAAYSPTGLVDQLIVYAGGNTFYDADTLTYSFHYSSGGQLASIDVDFLFSIFNPFFSGGYSKDATITLEYLNGDLVGYEDCYYRCYGNSCDRICADIEVQYSNVPWNKWMYYQFPFLGQSAQNSFDTNHLNGLEHYLYLLRINGYKSLPDNRHLMSGIPLSGWEFYYEQDQEGRTVRLLLESYRPDSTINRQRHFYLFE